MEMSFLGKPEEKNTQAQGNDCPHRPTHSQSRRVCFCYRLASFTSLLSSGHHKELLLSPGVSLFFPLLSFSASYSWVSGSSLTEIGYERQCTFLDKIMVQEPQWTWPLSPIRGGWAVHHGELGNASMAPNQERSLCIQCPSQWPPTTPSVPSCCFNP